MLESNVDLYKMLDRIAADRLRDDHAKASHYSEEDLRLLESEIAEVVTADRHPKLSGIECPVCDTQMKVCADHGLPEFGSLDVSLREMSCPTCGMLANRVYHPSIGYDTRMVR